MNFLNTIKSYIRSKAEYPLIQPAYGSADTASYGSPPASAPTPAQVEVSAAVADRETP